MKIAMIGHKRIPSREGGVEIVVSELAPRIANLGNEVDAYNRWDLFENNSIKRSKYFGNVRTYWVPTLKNPKLNAFLYSFFASIRVLFKRYDILHYHAIGSCAMLFLPKIFQKKIVVTVHGLDWQRSKWGGFATKYLLFGEKCAAKYADEIIVLSENVQKYFLEKYNRKTNFIVNGVSREKTLPVDIINKKYALEKNSYILYLARIVPEKGLHYLIGAYLKTVTDKKLVIAGKIDLSNDYVKEIIKKSEGNPNIIFTDFVSGDLLGELYSNCFLYVLPSDIEGMPISLLEAINYKARCLTSDIDENAQLCVGYGYMFRKSDTEDLFKVLNEILSNPIDNEMERAKKSDEILEKYDWNAVAKNTIKLYEGVIR